MMLPPHPALFLSHPLQVPFHSSLPSLPLSPIPPCPEVVVNVEEEEPGEEGNEEAESKEHCPGLSGDGAVVYVSYRRRGEEEESM